MCSQNAFALHKDSLPAFNQNPIEHDWSVITQTTRTPECSIQISVYKDYDESQMYYRGNPNSKHEACLESPVMMLYCSPNKREKNPVY